MLPVAMRWRHVLFENYPVEPAAVAARLPDALAVDTFDGDAWLSAVPFVNADVRPRGLPATAGLDLQAEQAECLGVVRKSKIFVMTRRFASRTT